MLSKSFVFVSRHIIRSITLFLLITVGACSSVEKHATSSTIVKCENDRVLINGHEINSPRTREEMVQILNPSFRTINPNPKVTKINIDIWDNFGITCYFTAGIPAYKTIAFWILEYSEPDISESVPKKTFAGVFLVDGVRIGRKITENKLAEAGIKSAETSLLWRKSLGEGMLLTIHMDDLPSKGLFSTTYTVSHIEISFDMKYAKPTVKDNKNPAPQPAPDEKVK